MELATVVASHLFDAYRADPDGADAEKLATRGRQALMRAAQRAADLHSHRQVLKLAERAASIASTDRDRGELEMLRARAARGLGDMEGAVEAARAAVELFRDADVELRMRAATLLGTSLTDISRHADAVAVMDDLAPETPETPAEIELAAALARAYMLGNYSHDAIRVADGALPAAERLDLVAPLVDMLITKASALMALERHHECLALLRGALAMAEDHDLTSAALRAHNNISVALGHDDDIASAENSRRAWAKALALGDPLWMSMYAYQVAAFAENEGRYEDMRAIQAQLGENMIEYSRQSFGQIWAWHRLTRGEVGLDEALESIQFYLDSQDPQHHVMFDQWMADVHFLVGDFERSYEYAMKARYIYGAPFHLETALWSAIFLGDADRIRTAAQALQSVESAGRITRSMKLAAAAAVAQCEGKTTEATQLARQYLDEIPKIRTGRDLAISIAVMARLLGTDHPLGAEAAREAHRILAEQGRTRLLEALADGLVASPTEAERLA